MQRHKLELSAEKIAGLDLDALARKAQRLNQRNRESYTAPFPKEPSRWLSHYRFEPRTIAFTSEGEVEGMLSWLAGSLFDLSFVRSLLAPRYSKEGGRCFDPASLFFLELALKLDGHSTDASLCRDLRQQEKGERYRTIAGIELSVPGKDDLCRFRSRVGSEPIDSITGVFVRFLTEEFSLIDDKVLCTDGQLEHSFSRYRGCAYFCAKCRQFPLDQSQRQQLHNQIASGAKRLQITCPFPEAVVKIRQAVKKKDFDPKVALIEIDYLPQESTEMSRAVDVAHLLGMSSKQLPPMIIKWSRLNIDVTAEQE